MPRPVPAVGSYLASYFSTACTWYFLSLINEHKKKNENKKKQKKRPKDQHKHLKCENRSKHRNTTRRIKFSRRTITDAVLIKYIYISIISEATVARGGKT